MPNTLKEALSTNSENNTIIPGTTPELIITLDDSDLLKDTVDFRIDITDVNPQTKVEELIIQTSNIEVHDNSIVHVFSQEETYRMTEGHSIKLQVHGLTDDDTAWKTNIFTLYVGETLSETMI